MEGLNVSLAAILGASAMTLLCAVLFAGDEAITGSSGGDTVVSFAGNGVFFVGQEGDLVYGSDGNDTIFDNASLDNLSGD